MIHSKRFTLKLVDFSKGFVVAFFTGCLTAIVDNLSPENILNPIGFRTYLVTGLIAGASYILKNWLTNSEGKIAKEPKKEIQ